MQAKLKAVLQRGLDTVLQLMCCCGPRGYNLLDGQQNYQDEAEQRLISQRSSTASETQLASSHVPPSFPGSDASGERPQLLVIMRHGHRQDEQDQTWTETAERPWDPPLSTKGRSQAKEAAYAMRELGIEHIITSPFVRCLQTSAEIVSTLDMKQNNWAVDWSLSEICDPRVLFGGRKELLDQVARREIDTWMWDGKQLPEVLNDFAYEESIKSEVQFPPRDITIHLPSYPETLHQGLRRYSKAFQGIITRSKGKSILLVTHGEALRKAVEMFAPGSEVYEVQHTGYVVLQCKAAGSSDLADWKLVTVPGETGVQWFEL
jgi:broad specificity phosphatase PhoE